ncbi:MAG: AlpA family phage regulatory protein [Burkholderiales bacterium]|nr:MAG: AlpA family phage regulatory protein [Burkholderiales bacterium]
MLLDQVRDNSAPDTLDRLIPLKEVMHRVGLGRTTIYKMIGESSFPRPVKLGRRASRWIEREVALWQHTQISARSRSD